MSRKVSIYPLLVALLVAAVLTSVALPLMASVVLGANPPEVLWTTTYDGSHGEGSAVAVDSSDCIIVVGRGSGHCGTYPIPERIPCVVVKYDSLGHELWYKSYHIGDECTFGVAVATDSLDNAL